MTAHEYKEIYRNLQVPIVNEKDERTGWQKVDVHKYLLSQKDNKAGEPEHYNIQKTTKGLGDLYSKVKAHFAKKDATLKVYVAIAEVQEKTFNSFKDVWYYASKAFWGKASPEEVQITLQLAVRFKLTEATALQNYCDEKTDGLAQGRIGLDCNGFVGNYLEKGVRCKPWDDNKPGFTNYEANNGIQSIMGKLGREVKSLNDIRFLQNYVMGLVDSKTKQVVNQFSSTGGVGHIVVTTPFTFPAMHKGKPLIKMQVVESTPDAGLTESEYFLLSGKDYVFRVFRGSKNQEMDVRLRPII